MNSLVKYDAACSAIAAAKSVDEVKDIRDMSIAMAAYARQANNRDMEADAVEIRLRATRRLDQLRQAQKETVGLAPAGRPSKIGLSKNPISDRPTLASQGIDKNLAHQSRTLGSLTDDQFEKVVLDTRDAVSRAIKTVVKGSEIAQAREAYDERKEQGGQVADLHALAKKGEKYSVIYADPPWEFKVYSGKGKMRSAERHYDTMTLDDIAALPVEALAAENCALFLWAVLPELPGALELIKAWSFNFKTVAFTWIKQNRGGEGLFTGMGYWTRANAEICILATRGSPLRLAMDVHQVIMAPVREHSRKPDETAPRIERLLAGPYLELFAREQRHGWTTWGNEIERGEFVEAAE